MTTRHTPGHPRNRRSMPFRHWTPETDRERGRDRAARGGYLVGTEPEHLTAGFLERLDIANAIRAERGHVLLGTDGTPETVSDERWDR